MVTLLTRMQTSKTDKYVYEFAHFVLLTLAINVDGLTADFIPTAVEEIQPGCVSIRVLGCLVGLYAHKVTMV